MPDTVVIGAGLVGLAVAFEAGSRGISTVIISPTHPRPGTASLAAAGLIAPSLGHLPPDAQAAFDTARDAFEPFIARVASVGGRDVPVGWGLIEMAVSDADAASLLDRAGPHSRFIDRAELTRLEPTLTHAPSALLHERDGWLNPVDLLSALAAAIDQLAAVSRQEGVVTGMHSDGSGIRVLVQDGPSITADRVVLAAGAWSPLIHASAVAVTPLKGQLIRVRSSGKLAHGVAGGDAYLVPRADGTIIVGSTSEHAAFDPKATAEGLSLLQDRLKSLSPALSANAIVTEQWAGLRPMTPDRLPLVGPSRTDPRILLACGHGRNGVLLAPATAHLIADHLQNNPIPETHPFHPTRLHHPANPRKSE